MNKFALTAAILAGAAYAKISQICIDETTNIGLVKDQAAAMDGGKHVSDISNMNDMPINDLVFARPTKLTVCSDNDLIHGVQIQHKIH